MHSGTLQGWLLKTPKTLCRFGSEENRQRHVQGTWLCQHGRWDQMIDVDADVVDDDVDVDDDVAVAVVDGVDGVMVWVVLWV